MERDARENWKKRKVRPNKEKFSESGHLLWGV